VTVDFEEVDYRATPMGELVLRRRRDPKLGNAEIHEIKLGDEFLMSSAFTAGEIALAELALARLSGSALDVVVGGLGLGYTADAALKHESVRSLIVIEALEGVIDWHRRGLVPLGGALTSDGRCRLVQGDFFELASAPERGFDEASPGRRFDAVLVDIDHSPRHLLRSGNKSFYEPAGLRRLARQLRPGGVFGIWSNDVPDREFEQALTEVFDYVDVRVVRFTNPYTGAEAGSTIYLGSKRLADRE